MATGVRSWSTTASSNSTADASVNWAEGQLPSSVNDSARAMMASVAKWRDDLSGATSTAGTSTAYTLTTNQTVALSAGMVIGFYPHTNNGATCTIAVDGLTAKPLRSAPNTELVAGALVAGTPYQATYFTSNSGEWILQGFTGVGEFTESEVLVGAQVAVTTNTATDVTSISLTAGDWDVWGTVITSPNTGADTSFASSWISSSSASVPTVPNKGAYNFVYTSTTNAISLPTGMRRISLSSTTTVYLSTYITFTLSNMSAYGYIAARRAR